MQFGDAVSLRNGAESKLTSSTSHFSESSSAMVGSTKENDPLEPLRHHLLQQARTVAEQINQRVARLVSQMDLSEIVLFEERRGKDRRRVDRRRN